LYIITIFVGGYNFWQLKKPYHEGYGFFAFTGLFPLIIQSHRYYINLNLSNYLVMGLIFLPLPIILLLLPITSW